MTGAPAPAGPARRHPAAPPSVMMQPGTDAEEPMADQAMERTTIEAPLERCVVVAEDVERYPEWARDVKSVDVLERDEEGRAARVAFRAAAMGHSARYVLRYSYAGGTSEPADPVRISWVLEQGDIMRRLDGEYVFEPGDGDDEATTVTYRLAVELAVPLPGFVKRRAETKIITTALDELKRRCEGAASQN